MFTKRRAAEPNIHFATLKRHPFALLIAALLAVDLAMVSSTLGDSITPAGRIDQAWCWVRPFAWAGNRVDLFLLSLVCCQVSLVTVWAFYDKKFIGLRLLGWGGAGLLGAVSLAVLHFARYSTIDLAAVFVYQTVGLLVGLAWLGRRGHNLELNGAAVGARSNAADRQFTLKDMLLFLTLAGAVCMVLSWLVIIGDASNFFLRWLYWIPISAQFRHFAEMFTFGCLTAVVVHSCWAVSGVALRITATLAVSAAIAWIFVFLRLQYAQYVALTVTQNEAAMAPGWIAWYVLQVTLTTIVLLVLRLAGCRLVREGGDSSVPTPKLPRRLIGWSVAAFGLVALIGVAYFAVFVAPSYLANRRLVRETEHIGGIWSQRSGVLFVAQHPIDHQAVAAMQAHPIITDLQVNDHRERDGTLERLPTLQFLSGITIFSVDATDESISALQKALPNASITVHRITRP